MVDKIQEVGGPEDEFVELGEYAEAMRGLEWLMCLMQVTSSA